MGDVLWPTFDAIYYISSSTMHSLTELIVCCEYGCQLVMVLVLQLVLECDCQANNETCPCLANKGLSYSTINSYLSALRHLHIIQEPQQASWPKFLAFAA